jgi:hypothetical protein
MIPCSPCGLSALSTTDYYSMIARCVADLQRNTAARHEFYWLARTELEVQLCGFNPPLPSSEMIRERLALNAAIHRFENECSSSAIAVVEAAKIPMAGYERMQVAEFLRPEIRPAEIQQWQAKNGPTLEPTSIVVRPLIAMAGLLLVIGLGSTLYSQRDRVTALLAESVTLPHSVSKSLPKLDYYVGRLGEMALTARRQAK